MHPGTQALAALLLAASLAHAGDPAPIEVTVASADHVLLDPPADSAAAQPALRVAEGALLRELRTALSNLVTGASALTGTGPGPWRVHADIVEWISPGQLRGAFGHDAPGIALQASLFDGSRGEKVPRAIADFPAPAARLAAGKSSRVLPIDEAARQVTGWITAEIVSALSQPAPAKSGDAP